MEIDPLIQLARGGNIAAYGQLVEATQAMVYAVTYRVLRDHALALDAVQDTYIRAFQRLADLREQGAFPGWLRRIAVTTAQNLKRQRTAERLWSEALPEVPILDDLEETWADAQRRVLATALLQLPYADRRICDRFYHGGWSVARLATDAGATEPTMRKRLQRIRDQLRKDQEMSEQSETAGHRLPPDLPQRIVELLATPRLVDLPENPVGHVADLLRTHYAGFEEVEIPEIISLAEVQRMVGQSPLCMPAERLHHVDADRVLRFDTELPLLLAAAGRGTPLRLIATGPVYRDEGPDAFHLQAFHQFEVLWADDALDTWSIAGDVLKLHAKLFPKHAFRVTPATYPTCTQGWELSMEIDGNWRGVAAWGLCTPQIVRHLGGDPGRVKAVGLGIGLERLAALHFGYDDLRKLQAARVG